LYIIIILLVPTLHENQPLEAPHPPFMPRLLAQQNPVARWASKDNEPNAMAMASATTTKCDAARAAPRSRCLGGRGGSLAAA